MKKIFLIRLSGLLTSACIFAVVVLYLIFFYKTTNDFTLRIYPGYSYNNVIERLNEKCQLPLLRYLYKTKKVIQNKYKPKIGNYKIIKGSTIFDIIKKLYRGEQDPILLVIREGIIDFQELVEYLSKVLLCNYEEFIKVLSDDKFLELLGLNKYNILTVFIPNTYNIYWTISAKELICRMDKESKKFWNTNRYSKAQKLKLNNKDIYTLASIVYKETTNKIEARTIAGVYINRIKKRMHLGANPTVIYVLRKKISRLYYKETKIDSLYNTYQKYGLPPGPICIPSIEFIDAVLDYTEKQHDYIYFCAKTDFSGLHWFAKSFKEHRKNSNNYRMFLSKNKIFR